MPAIDNDPQLAEVLQRFEKTQADYLASAAGKLALKTLTGFATALASPKPDQVFGKAMVGGAQACLDWLQRLPPELLDKPEARLPMLAEMDAKARSQVVAEALQVTRLGMAALLLGPVGDKDLGKRLPDLLLGVAWGTDTAAMALRQALVPRKWPKGTWLPEVPKGLTPDALLKLILAGTVRDLQLQFARCGSAARAQRDWAQQVRAFGQVTSLTPGRACAGQRLVIGFSGFGSAAPAGDVLVCLPTRGACQHVSLRVVAPQLFASGGWVASGSIEVVLPAGVFTGAVGFMLVPPRPGEAGCEVGGLATAAGMLQSLQVDAWGPGAAQGTQPLVRVAAAVEGARLSPLPCAGLQPDGRNKLLAGPPVVVQFDLVEQRPVYPQGTITLRWAVDNADSVQFSVVTAAGSESPHELPAIPGTFAASGQLVLQASCTRRWDADIVLQATNANACGGPVTQTLRVRSGFAHWRLGAGRADIIDRRPNLPMAGFAYSQQVGNGTLQRNDHGRDLPLYARAFYVAEHSLSLNRRELIIVVADIWTCTLALKREVLVALNLALPAAPGQGTRWDDANVMLCGTHTHAAPGGYSEYALYNLTVGGFDQGVFNTLVRGTTLAAVQAVQAARPGRLQVNTGMVDDCGVQRSMPAFLRNPEANAGVEPTDREMLLLKFSHDVEGPRRSLPVGALTWYAIHPTSLGMYNRMVSGDNKGWAAWRLEDLMQSTHQGFVAAFGNASAGDVSGNYRRNAQGQPEFVRPLGGVLPAGGSFPPRSMDPNAAAADESRMRDLGNAQAVHAQLLFNAATEEVTGRLDLQHRFVDMSMVQINGQPGARTWSAALGVSFGAGSSEDSIAYATLGGFDVDANIPEGVDQALNALGAVTGVAMALAVLPTVPMLLVKAPSLPLSLAATLTTGAPLSPELLGLVMPVLATLLFPPSRAWVAARVAAAALPGQIPVPDAQYGSCTWQLPDLFGYPSGYGPGHGEKPIMFPVGLAQVSYTPASAEQGAPLASVDCPLVPQVLPMHLVRLGTVVLAGVPAEFTATAGRRLKASLRQALGSGVSQVAVAGYCNGYSGYVATAEEYAAQHYEGASTLFGEHTLAAYRQTFTGMASVMNGGSWQAIGRASPPRLVVHRAGAAPTVR